MTTQRGFTLVEMMAVMVLLGLLAGIILPNFERWFESTQDKVSATEIASNVQKLLIRSALLEEDFLLETSNIGKLLSDGQPALTLPSGWRMQEDQQLNVWRSGICDHAEIYFTHAKKIIAIDIEDQTCFVSISKNENITHAKK